MATKTKTHQVGRRIAPDGTETTVQPGKRDFSLEELQAHVGGYIERVNVPGIGHATFYADEDGLSKGLPENPRASEIAGQRIVGPVLIVSRGN